MGLEGGGKIIIENLGVTQSLKFVLDY